MSQLPQSAPSRSKLEAYRYTIHQEWLKDTPVLEIARILADAGCSIKRTRISTWIDNEVRVGRFPQRKEPFVGRPKKNRPQPVSAAPLSFDVEDFRKMEGFLKAVVRQIRPTELAAELAIPSKLETPDYESYAKSLGKEGVIRLGKMDYILLGLYSMRLLMDQPQGTPNFVEMLCGIAELTRSRMRTAVALDS